MPSLTITNQKGGVGKTTTTLNLAAALQELGVRVLTVDFDPQGSLTTSCGMSDPTELGPGQTIADALLTTMHHPVPNPVTIQDVIVHTPAGLDLVPSNHQLATAERILYAFYGREFALRQTLAPVRNQYDLILVDSVPTLGLLAINSLAAVDGLIIPVQAEFLAVHGLAQVLESVTQVREHLNSGLQIWGVVLTMVDGRTKHSRDIVQLVRENLPGQVPVFKTEIPVDVKLKESSRAGRTVLQLDPRTRGARAYRELANEVAVLVPAAKLATASVQNVTIELKPPTPANGSVPETGSIAPLAPPPVPTANEVSRNHSPVSHGLAETIPHVKASAKKIETNGKTAATATPARIQGVCPYLGLLNDPGAHGPHPNPDHRCFTASPALQIEGREQYITCLTVQHTSCDRFFRATLNSVVPPATASGPDSSASILSRLRKFVRRGA